MKRFLAVLIAVACACLGTAAAQDKGAKAPSADVKRGRYLVQITGCNDCHTPGYPESAGKVDEKLWLTGRAARLARPLGHDLRRQPAPRRAEHDRGAVDDSGCGANCARRCPGSTCAT